MGNLQLFIMSDWMRIGQTMIWALTTYFLVVWDLSVFDVLATIWEWVGSAVGSLRFTHWYYRIDPATWFSSALIVSVTPCLISISTSLTSYRPESSFAMFVIGMVVNTWHRLLPIRPLEQTGNSWCFQIAMVFQSNELTNTTKNQFPRYINDGLWKEFAI